jgi:hypothetical protein
METGMVGDREEELEARRKAALEALAELDAEIEAMRAESRAQALAEVQANVRKYKITRTELAPYFPQIRKSKSTVALATDGTQSKRRGRPKKVKTEGADVV